MNPDDPAFVRKMKEIARRERAVAQKCLELLDEIDRAWTEIAIAMNMDPVHRKHLEPFKVLLEKQLADAERVLLSDQPPKGTDQIH